MGIIIASVARDATCTWPRGLRKISWVRSANFVSISNRCLILTPRTALPSRIGGARGGLSQNSTISADYRSIGINKTVLFLRFVVIRLPVRVPFPGRGHDRGYVPSAPHASWGRMVGQLSAAPSDYKCGCCSVFAGICTSRYAEPPKQTNRHPLYCA
jgi:hypothetical protein